MDARPLAIDLFCGLGGWTDGLLAEGWDVVGFDIERHEYAGPAMPASGPQKGTRPVEKRGWTQGCAVSLGLEGTNKQPDTHIYRYPAQLVLQDVLTLDGAQCKDANLIVASPPCQEYSYMAMPWSRAKQIAAALKGEGEFPEGYTGSRTLDELNALFDACFRIQKEACEAAGRHVPMVVENVRGAQPWVGRAKWNYGSFYLWGDVPALMPTVFQRNFKGSTDKRDGTGPGKGNNPDWRKHGGDWFSDPSSPGRQGGSGRKNKDADGYERSHPNAFGWKKPRTSSGSTKRKFASAMIAKIPLPLSRYIASVYRPDERRAA